MDIKSERLNMPDEKYERNYVAIEEISDTPTGTNYFVTGYFANHKVAWYDDNTHRSREDAQDHAEFLIKEFSMGDEHNPIAVIHLNDRRQVMVKGEGGRWINTFASVNSRL